MKTASDHFRTGKARKKTRWIDYGGFALLIVIVASMVMVTARANVKKIRNAQAEQKALTEQLTFLVDIQNTMGQGEDLLSGLQTRIRELNDYLPEDMDFEGFYETLSNLSKQDNVLIYEIQPSNLEMMEEYQVLTVGVEAVATFEACHQFLFDLFGASRLVKLNGLSISIGEQPHLCDINVRLDIFASGKEMS